MQFLPDTVSRSALSCQMEGMGGGRVYSSLWMLLFPSTLPVHLTRTDIGGEAVASWVPIDRILPSLHLKGLSRRITLPLQGFIEQTKYTTRSKRV